jgi:hypothetical protein
MVRLKCVLHWDLRKAVRIRRDGSHTPRGHRFFSKDDPEGKHLRRSGG